MSGSEEETYSIMFSSLRHPARRKILRMLSENTLTFSQMLEELAIPSSHLTYHLENLGELIVKDEEGKYKLSSFGNSSVAIMKGAEDVPSAQSKRFSALPLRWKSLYAALIIGLVLVAGFSFLQYSSVNLLSADYNKLKTDFDRLTDQNQRLLSWSSSASKAMAIIRDVMELDVSQYQSKLLSDTIEIRDELGGAIEEVMKYSFESNVSRFELTLRFRDNHFSLLQLNQLDGYPPIYTRPQPTDVMQRASELLDRYKTASDNQPYLQEMSTLLASANQTAVVQTLGNTKLQISTFGSNAEILLYYTENGTDFSYKSVQLIFENQGITKLTDDWSLYKIETTKVNVSREQAIQIAKTAAEHYEWNADGVQVSDFTVLDQPVSAEFFPHPRAQVLTLVPYWYVTLHLDKTYPGDVSVIAVGVWADTGEIANVKALGGQSAPN